ncbi:unnamed protein product [Orchesella dallaii]|uniref:Uncharacterized protein n=1 Tax=Orchesella dallaii TaxID=48710 RepID=A0ABP1QW64_9HEXA
MNSFRSLLFFGLIAYCHAQSTMIESKLDGKVLTVTNKTVPPTGPYERLGVAVMAADHSHVLPQHWEFNDFSGQNQGQILPVDARVWNSLTALLPCDDCFAYFYTYDFGQNGTDGSRLLRRVDTDTCVKNPGQDGFITDAECDENDVSQLWIIHASSIKRKNHDSVEEELLSSEELEYKSSSASEEEAEIEYHD